MREVKRADQVACVFKGLKIRFSNRELEIRIQDKLVIISGILWIR